MAFGHLPSLPLPSDGLDLAALRRADAAVRDAAAEARATAIADRLATAIDPLDPAAREVVRLLIGEMGRLEARVIAAEQAAGDARRSRGDWVSLDPLRMAPPRRTAPAPATPSRVEVHAGDPAFHGTGWHGAEGRSGGTFRWSDHVSVASVVLPSLGAGRIAVRVDLIAPFSLPIRAEDLRFIVDGEAPGFTLTAEGNPLTTAAFEIVSTDEPGAGLLGIVIGGPRYGDPAGREKRGLGIGIRRIVAERV